MNEKLLNSIKNKDLSSYPDVHSYVKPLDKALWTLLISKKVLKISEHISSQDISTLLFLIDISCDQLSITRALTTAKDMVDKKGESKNRKYKIMKKGEDYLIKEESNLRVYYVEGNKPWSDRRMLIHEFIKNVKGDVMIVDKFFSKESLDLLSEFKPSQEIKFLTAKIIDESNKFKRDVKKFKIEYNNVIIRKYPKEFELHDRYILTSSEICLLGHGLADIGNKESFILVLSNSIGKEIRTMLSQKFDARWSKAQNYG